MTPSRDDPHAGTPAPAPVSHRPPASAGRGTFPRGSVDLGVVGTGPTATLLALSAHERGLSVALLHEGGRTPSPGPRTGLVGYRHPYGYRWLARRHGAGAARRFAAMATTGRQRFEHLVTTYQIPCGSRLVSCRVGTLQDDPRPLRSELAALVGAGLPVRAAADAAAPMPFSLARHRLPDERAIDVDALVRGSSEVAQTRGVVVDGSLVGQIDRLPGLRGAWGVVTDKAEYVCRHVVQTGPALSDHTNVRARSLGANTLLIDTADVVPEGRYSFHARRPMEVVAYEHRDLGHRRLVVRRFGGRRAVDGGFEEWAAQTWSGGLLRDRWWTEAPMRRGLPVYGQVGRSRRWLLGGLEAWGISVQSHVADRVAAAVAADLSEERATGRLHWRRPTPVAARAASG